MRAGCTVRSLITKRWRRVYTKNTAGDPRSVCRGVYMMREQKIASQRGGSSRIE